MYSNYSLHNRSPQRSRSPQSSSQYLPQSYPQRSSQHLPKSYPQRSRSPKSFSTLSQRYSISEEIENQDPITPRNDDDDTILIDPPNPYNPSPYNSISSTFGLEPNWSRRNSRRDGDTYYYNELSGQTQWEQPLNQEQRNALDELMRILNMELEHRVALRRNQ